MLEEEWMQSRCIRSLLQQIEVDFRSDRHRIRLMRLLSVSTARRHLRLTQLNLARWLEYAEQIADHPGRIIRQGELRLLRKVECHSVVEEGVVAIVECCLGREIFTPITSVGYEQIYRREYIANAVHWSNEVVYQKAIEDSTDMNNWSEAREYEKKIQADYVRCIFGNPFRPVAFDPAWRSATVVALAEAIYADRAFDRLPILADALEEAGCDHPDVLAHCRGPGPHARGCWVVDLILGKG